MNPDGSRIAEIAPENLTPEQTAILEAVQRGRGFLPRPFKVWVHNPKLAEPMEAIGTYLNTESTLTYREYEIAIAVLAVRMNAPFVIKAHLRNMQQGGHPPEVTAAIAEGRTPELATERERVIYEIARTAFDRDPAPDELFDRTVAALGRDGLADLIALIGYYTGVALAMKIHKVPA